MLQKKPPQKNNERIAGTSLLKHEKKAKITIYVYSVDIFFQYNLFIEKINYDLLNG